MISPTRNSIHFRPSQHQAERLRLVTAVSVIIRARFATNVGRGGRQPTVDARPLVRGAGPSTGCIATADYVRPSRPGDGMVRNRGPYGSRSSMDGDELRRLPAVGVVLEHESLADSVRTRPKCRAAGRAVGDRRSSSAGCAGAGRLPLIRRAWRAGRSRSWKVSERASGR